MGAAGLEPACTSAGALQALALSGKQHALMGWCPAGIVGFHRCLLSQNRGGWRELNSRKLIHNQSPEPLGYTRHVVFRTWRRRDLNSQPSACKAGALPLRHIPR